MKTSVFKKLNSSYVSMGQKLGSAFTAPSRTQAQIGLFVIGAGLLSVGLADIASAQGIGGGGGVGQGVPAASNIRYNDTRIQTAIATLLGYLEGSFGAMIMVAAGVGAIMSAAFGQYKAALSLLVVAVGAFILRSLVTTFFFTNNI